MIVKRLNPNKELQAYIIGLALGDGNLSNPNGRATRLRITCDTRYPFLIEKVRVAVEQLLPDNKVSIQKANGNYVNVSSYSNIWQNLVGWQVGKGSKFAQSARVPDWVFRKREYMISCLRGLLETDGSLYYDRGYPMVMFVNTIPHLIEDVLLIIMDLGFMPRLYKIIQTTHPKGYNQQPVYHVRLSKNVKEFLNVVQFHKA